MIYNSDIQIPVLCPIQFREPKEIDMYNRQNIYTPKIVTGQIITVTFLISENIYLNADLQLRLFDKDDNLLSASIIYKYTLSAGHYYAVGSFLGAQYYQDKCVIFKIIDDDNNIYADSIPYIINPPYKDDIKIITYKNSVNDWNMIFPASVPNYSLAVECGFIPRDFRGEQETEDYLDQSLTNETIYGNHYEVHPLTIGDNGGIPNWLAYKIMCATLCDTFKIDDVEYKRVNGSSFEKVEDTENGLAIYKVDLQTENTYLQ